MGWVIDMNTQKKVLPNGSYAGDTPNHFFCESLITEIEKYLVEKNVATVYEFGSGNGLYTKHLRQLFDVDSSDGNPYTVKITNGESYVLDLSKPFNKPKRDAILCLEVGEHIPKQFEQTFLDNIAKHADLIILSWAVVGQGGPGHVNCQNNDYIIAEMDKRGFKYYREPSVAFKEAATLGWFKNGTIMTFEIKQ